VAVSDVRERHLRGPVLNGALLPAKPVITQKPKLDIPHIVAVNEGRPVVLDNSVQNSLGF